MSYALCALYEVPGTRYDERMKYRHIRNMTPTPSEMPPSSDPVEIAMFAAELGGSAPELDLHGLPPDEAVRELDMFVNLEFAGKPRRDLKVIKIVHGRGGGVLRNAVMKFLKTCPFVKRFRDAQDPAQTNGVIYAALSPNKK